MHLQAPAYTRSAVDEHPGPVGSSGARLASTRPVHGHEASTKQTRNKNVLRGFHEAGPQTKTKTYITPPGSRPEPAPNPRASNENGRPDRPPALPGGWGPKHQAVGHEKKTTGLLATVRYLALGHQNIKVCRAWSHDSVPGLGPRKNTMFILPFPKEVPPPDPRLFLGGLKAE